MTPFRLSTRVRPAPSGRASGRASVGAGNRVHDAEGGGSANAVPVPWRVSARSKSGVIEVEHIGSEALHSVRFALAGQGMLGLSLPGTVHPGERVRVVVRGVGGDAASASDAMLVLRWFQPDGQELLWPIAL